MKPYNGLPCWHTALYNREDPKYEFTKAAEYASENISKWPYSLADVEAEIHNSNNSSSECYRLDHYLIVIYTIDDRHPLGVFKQIHIWAEEEKQLINFTVLLQELASAIPDHRDTQELIDLCHTTIQILLSVDTI